MCGIVGYFNKRSTRTYVDSIIEKMDALQKHRGPDSSGKFINKEGNFGLKMSRLSILDPELGIQPMHSRDKRFTIIFNGTIINSPKLRNNVRRPYKRAQCFQNSVVLYTYTVKSYIDISISFHGYSIFSFLFF